MLHLEWTGLLDKLNLNGQPSKIFVHMLCTFTRNFLMFIVLTQKLVISSTRDNATSISATICGGFYLRDASSSTEQMSNILVPIVTKPHRSNKRRKLFSVFDTPFDDEEESNNHMSRFDSKILEENPDYYFEANCG